MEQEESDYISGQRWITVTSPDSLVRLPCPCLRCPASVWWETGVCGGEEGCVLSLTPPQSPWAQPPPAGLWAPAPPRWGTCWSAARSLRAEPQPTPRRACWWRRAEATTSTATTQIKSKQSNTFSAHRQGCCSQVNKPKHVNKLINASKHNKKC